MKKKIVKYKKGGYIPQYQVGTGNTPISKDTLFVHDFNHPALRAWRANQDSLHYYNKGEAAYNETKDFIKERTRNWNNAVEKFTTPAEKVALTAGQATEGRPRYKMDYSERTYTKKDTPANKYTAAARYPLEGKFVHDLYKMSRYTRDPWKGEILSNVAPTKVTFTGDPFYAKTFSGMSKEKAEELRKDMRISKDIRDNINQTNTGQYGINLSNVLAVRSETPGLKGDASIRDRTKNRMAIGYGGDEYDYTFRYQKPVDMQPVVLKPKPQPQPEVKPEISKSLVKDTAKITIKPPTPKVEIQEQPKEVQQEAPKQPTVITPGIEAVTKPWGETYFYHTDDTGRTKIITEGYYNTLKNSGMNVVDKKQYGGYIPQYQDGTGSTPIQPSIRVEEQPIKEPYTPIGNTGTVLPLNEQGMPIKWLPTVDIEGEGEMDWFGNYRKPHYGGSPDSNPFTLGVTGVGSAWNLWKAGTKAAKNAAKAVKTFGVKGAVKNAAEDLVEQGRNIFRSKPNADEVNWGNEYFHKVATKKKRLQKPLVAKRITWEQYQEQLKSYEKQLQKELGLGEEIGSGAYGSVYTLADNPSKLIKLGNPLSKGQGHAKDWTPEIIENLKNVRQNANIAIPEKVDYFDVPSVWKGYGSSKKEVMQMSNLNEAQAANLNLSKRDRYALFLKQARQLRDQGVSLDVSNIENFNFNKNKGVFDIYDINPYNITSPVHYMQRVRNETRGPLFENMLYKKGGYIPQYQDGGKKDYWDADPNVLAFRKKFVERYGEEPSRDPKVAKYDYDAAFNAGVRPVYDFSDGLYHWDSRYKGEDHPNRYVNGIDTKTGKAINKPFKANTGSTIGNFIRKELNSITEGGPYGAGYMVDEAQKRRSKLRMLDKMPVIDPSVHPTMQGILNLQEKQKSMIAPKLNYGGYIPQYQDGTGSIPINMYPPGFMYNAMQRGKEQQKTIDNLYTAQQVAQSRNPLDVAAETAQKKAAYTQAQREKHITENPQHYNARVDYPQGIQEPGATSDILTDPTFMALTMGAMPAINYGMGRVGNFVAGAVNPLDLGGRGSKSMLKNIDEEVLRSLNPKHAQLLKSKYGEFTPEQLELLKPADLQTNLVDAPKKVYRSVFDPTNLKNPDTKDFVAAGMNNPITSTRKARQAALNINPGVYTHDSKMNVGMSTVPNKADALNIYGAKLYPNYDYYPGAGVIGKQTPTWIQHYKVDPSSRVLSSEDYYEFNRISNGMGWSGRQKAEYLQKLGYDGIKKWGDSPEIQFLKPDKSLSLSKLKKILPDDTQVHRHGGYIPQYGLGGTLQDIGKLALNTVAAPLEQISGNNFVNFNYDNKWASDAAAVSEGIIGAVTDVAGTAVAGPAYGTVKSGIQGVSKNIGNSQEAQRGANQWANTTGQLTSGVGSLASAFVNPAGAGEGTDLLKFGIPSFQDGTGNIPIGIHKGAGVQPGRKAYMPIQNEERGKQVKEDFEKAKSFMLEYIGSPMYMKRLTESGYENPELTKDLRRARVEKAEPYIFESSIAESYTMPHKPDDNRVRLFPNTYEKAWGEHYPGWTEAHELSHLAGAGDPIKKSKRHPGNLDEVMNAADMQRLYDVGRSKHFYGDPLEIKANIDAVRYKLKELGIYDAGNEEFTKEHLQKADEHPELERMRTKNWLKGSNSWNIMRKMQDEQLIDLMNKVAQNPQVTDKTYAQHGGSVNTTGYLKGAPTVNNPVNIIPSNNITTDNMAFPIFANGKPLYPNTGEYNFDSPYVVERPMYQQGGRMVQGGAMVNHGYGIEEAMGAGHDQGGMMLDDGNGTPNAEIDGGYGNQTEGDQGEFVVSDNQDQQYVVTNSKESGNIAKKLEKRIKAFYRDGTGKKDAYMEHIKKSAIDENQKYLEEKQMKEQKKMMANQGKAMKAFDRYMKKYGGYLMDESPEQSFEQSPEQYYRGGYRKRSKSMGTGLDLGMVSGSEGYGSNFAGMDAALKHQMAEGDHAGINAIGRFQNYSPTDSPRVSVGAEGWAGTGPNTQGCGPRDPFCQIRGEVGATYEGGPHYQTGFGAYGSVTPRAVIPGPIQTSISGTAGVRHNFDTGQTNWQSPSARLGFGVPIIPNKLGIEGGLNYQTGNNANLAGDLRLKAVLGNRQTRGRRFEHGGKTGCGCNECAHKMEHGGELDQDYLYSNWMQYPEYQKGGYLPQYQFGTGDEPLPGMTSYSPGMIDDQNIYNFSGMQGNPTAMPGIGPNRFTGIPGIDNARNSRNLGKGLNLDYSNPTLRQSNPTFGNPSPYGNIGFSTDSSQDGTGSSQDGTGSQRGSGDDTTQGINGWGQLGMGLINNVGNIAGLMTKRPTATNLPRIAYDPVTAEAPIREINKGASAANSMLRNQGSGNYRATTMGRLGVENQAAMQRAGIRENVANVNRQGQLGVDQVNQQTAIAEQEMNDKNMAWWKDQRLASLTAMGSNVAKQITDVNTMSRDNWLYQEQLKAHPAYKEYYADKNPKPYRTKYSWQMFPKRNP